MLEKAFYEEKVDRICLSFEFYYGVFFRIHTAEGAGVGELDLDQCLWHRTRNPGFMTVKKVEDSPALELELFCYPNGDLEFVEVSENIVNETGNHFSLLQR